MNHIMLDLETLSTRADAVIVSIGAVKFDETEIDPQCFYAICELDQPGRHVSPNTLAWWMQQSDAARAVFNDRTSPRFFLSDALLEFRNFVDRADYHLWSYGASFDIPILNHAFDTTNIERPSKHSNDMCFRTMKKLFKQVPAPAFEGTQHNALADAINQAKHLQAIWKFMKEGPTPPSRGFGAKH